MLLKLFIFFFLLCFIAAAVGYTSVKSNVLSWLLSIEIMFFATNMVFSPAPASADDLMGQIYVSIPLSVIAGESASAFVSSTATMNVKTGEKYVV